MENRTDYPVPTNAALNGLKDFFEYFHRLRKLANPKVRVATARKRVAAMLCVSALHTSASPIEDASDTSAKGL